MSNLPTLLRRQKELFKQFLELEREIADLDQQIIAAGTSAHASADASARRERGSAPRRNSRPSKANGGVSDSIRETLRILQQAGEPLTPREVAIRMGIEPKIASRYLAAALKLRLVERLPNFRYRVISAVPTLEARDVRPA